MNVALINPPSKFDHPIPSLGIAYIASSLKVSGHDGRIFDLWAEAMEDAVLRDKLEAYAPNLIGVTFFTRRFVETRQLINKIKSWFPDVPLVVGGAHASALPAEVLELIPAVDYVIIGEGELTAVELLENMGSGQLDAIHGLAFRRDGQVVITEPREANKNLDALPYPDLEQVDPSRYRIHPPYGWYGLPLPVITARGCPAKCTFCSKSVFRNSVRRTSQEAVIKQIKYWKERLPVHEIRFFDDDFTMSKKWTHKFCDLMIAEKINMPWTCTTRVDFLDRDLLVKMKQAGLYFIVLGVESGSQKVLDALQKGYTVEQVRNAFKWCRELGILTFGFFLIGSPEETEADWEVSLDLQKEIKPNFSSWGTLRILPGSTLFEDAFPNGSYPFDPNSEVPYFDLYRQDLDADKMQKFCQKATMSQYLSITGFTSGLRYFIKTGNLGAIKDYFRLLFGTL